MKHLNKLASANTTSRFLYREIEYGHSREGGGDMVASRERRDEKEYVEGSLNSLKENVLKRQQPKNIEKEQNQKDLDLNSLTKKQYDGLVKIAKAKNYKEDEAYFILTEFDGGLCERGENGDVKRDANGKLVIDKASFEGNLKWAEKELKGENEKKMFQSAVSEIVKLKYPELKGDAYNEKSFELITSFIDNGDINWEKVNLAYVDAAKAFDERESDKLREKLDKQAINDALKLNQLGYGPYSPEDVLRQVLAQNDIQDFQIKNKLSKRDGYLNKETRNALSKAVQEKNKKEKLK
jgi:hypothetical protein